MVISTNDARQHAQDYSGPGQERDKSDRVFSWKEKIVLILIFLHCALLSSQQQLTHCSLFTMMSIKTAAQFISLVLGTLSDSATGSGSLW